MGALLVSTLNRLCDKRFYYFSAEVVTHLHPSRPNTAHLHPLAQTLHLSKTQLMIFINVDVSNIYFTVSTLQTGTTYIYVANGFSTRIHGKRDSTVCTFQMMDNKHFGQIILFVNMPLYKLLFVNFISRPSHFKTGRPQMLTNSINLQGRGLTELFFF